MCLTSSINSTIMRACLIIIVTLCLLPQAVAQKLSLGPAFGFMNRQISASLALADTVELRALRGFGNMENVYGLTATYALRDKIRASVRPSYREFYDSWLVTRNDAAVAPYRFAPKVGATGGRALSLGLHVELEVLRVSLKRDLVAYATLGGTGALISKINSGYVHEFTEGDGYISEANVLNNLQHIYRKSTLSSMLGLRLEYAGFSILGTFDRSVGRVTTDLDYFGTRYPLNAYTRQLTFLAGYEFTLHKRKKR